MRPNTRAASPRSSWVSRLTRASSNTLRSKRAWNVPPEVGLGEVAHPPRVTSGALQALVGMIDVAPARRRDQDAAASLASAEVGIPLGSRGSRSAPGRASCNSSRCHSVASAAPCRRAPRVAVPRAAANAQVGAAHAGVVHAPGRAQPARVPGAPRRGSILDAIKQPDARRRDHAAAGAPLRRRRRRAVQRHRRAGARRRLRHRRRARHRTGRRRPLRRPPTSTACAPLEPADIAYVAGDGRAWSSPSSARDVPLLAFAGAPFTVASYLIEGGPSRTYEHTKALMHTDERAVARRDGAPGGARRGLRSTPSSTRRPGLPAVRLVGRRAVRRRLRALRAAPLAPGVRRRRRRATRTRPGSTSASAATTSSRSMCDGRPEVHRPRLAHADRRGPPAARRRPRRAGQPRSGARARRPRRRRSPAPGAVLADNGGHPGHIFNLGHGVQPNTDPGVLAAVVDLVHDGSTGAMTGATGGRALMAYGTPRTPDEILPYYTDIRRGRPPTAEQLADLTRRYDAIGGISPLAARDRGPARRAAGRARRARPRRLRRRARAEARRPEDRGRRRRAGGGGVERVVGLVLAPHYSALSVGEYLGAAGRRGRGGAASPFVGVESWATEPAFVDFLAADVARRLATMPARHARWCSPPTRCPQRILDAGDPYPDELRATRRGRRRPRSGSSTDRWRIGWQRPGARPSRGSGPTSSRSIDDLGRRATPTGCWCARAASSPTTSRCSTTSTSRPASGRRRPASPSPRTACVNDDPAVIGALADRVVAVDRDDAGVVVVGGGITGLAAADAARPRSLPGASRSSVLRGRRPRSAARSARRRSPACPPSTRAPTRSSPGCPHATALARDVGLGADAHVADRRARPRCGGTACTRSPRGCCSACRPTCVAARPQPPAVVAGASCAPPLEPLLPRAADAADSLGALVRGPLRRRGPRAPRRPAGRQHLRRRHRPLQPGRGAADRRARRASRSLLLGARAARPPAPPPARCSTPPAAGSARSSTPSPTAAAPPASTSAPVAPVTELAADGGAWRVDGEPVDAVVLATPGGCRPRRWSPAPPPEAARLLATMEHAGVVARHAGRRRDVAAAAARPQRLPRARSRCRAR